MKLLLTLKCTSFRAVRLMEDMRLKVSDFDCAPRGEKWKVVRGLCQHYDKANCGAHLKTSN